MLVAGAVLPPNRASCLTAGRWWVLAQVKYTYDLVEIDTPRLTAVSDSFPLLTKVDVS